MKTEFITPQDVNNQIVSYPQCVDNQAVPLDLFNKIVSDRALSLETYLDASAIGVGVGDSSRFWEFQKREYNRALIFSQKIVVNRAAFWNNPVFIRAILGEERESFVQLLGDQVILPFLLKENSFEEEPSTGFGIVDLGKDAMNSLVNEIGSITCIHFDDNKARNDALVDKLDARFHTEFVQSVGLPEPRNILLGPAMTLLGKNIVNNDVDELVNEMLQVSKFAASSYINGSLPRRNGIYKEFIVQPGTSPERGKYRSGKFIYQIKQWVDAIYNSNGPSMLGVLTFTPYGFPTPYDLLISWALNPQQQAQSVQSGTEYLNEMLDRTKTNLTIQKQWNTFIKKADLYIPDPHELTHQNIQMIREWDEWKNMQNALQLFLQNPDKRETFLKVYDIFNRKLGSWYVTNKTQDQLNNLEPCIPAILVLYRFKKLAMGILLGEGVTLPYSNFEKLPEIDEFQIRGTLEIGLLLINRLGVDWKRSQNMRQIKKGIGLTSDDIHRLWNQIEEIKRNIPQEMISMGKILEDSATNEDYT